MATDLRLAQQPNGRYDFVRTATGGLEQTEDVAPALLRLAIQGEWIADNGERAGPSLPDIRIDDGTAADQARLILETRYAALVRRGDLQSFEVVSAVTDGDGDLLVDVLYAQPGAKPRPLQVRVSR